MDSIKYKNYTIVIFEQEPNVEYPVDDTVEDLDPECIGTHGYRVYKNDELIYEVCRLTPSKRHWLPTREAWIKDHVSRAPANLIIRFSVPMVDQEPAGSWPHTSTVVTAGATCPAPKQGNQCKDCRNCWNKDIKNISYGQH